MRILIFFVLLALCLTCPALAISPWQAGSIAEAISSGSWETSEKLFRKVKNGPLPPEQMPQVDYNLGVSLYEQEKYEESLPLFETAAKVEKNDDLRAKALYNKGNALFRLERLEEAKKAFQEALLSNPDDDDARYNIEVILDKQEQQKNQQDQDDKQEPEKDQEDQNQDQKDEEQSQDQDSKNSDQQDKQGEQDPSEQDQEQGEKEQQEGQGQDEQEQEMSEAEQRAAQEAAEQARLLDYFRQQERDKRPATRMRAQAPPVRGKTW